MFFAKLEKVPGYFFDDDPVGGVGRKVIIHAIKKFLTPATWVFVYPNDQ